MGDIAIGDESAACLASRLVEGNEAIDILTGKAGKNDAVRFMNFLRDVFHQFGFRQSGTPGFPT